MYRLQKCMQVPIRVHDACFTSGNASSLHVMCSRRHPFSASSCAMSASFAFQHAENQAGITLARFFGNIRATFLSLLYLITSTSESRVEKQAFCGHIRLSLISSVLYHNTSTLESHVRKQAEQYGMSLSQGVLAVHCFTSTSFGLQKFWVP